jgi:type VI secretion system protein ImpJ
MDPANKLLWREGLFLTPQHFQAMDRHNEWLSWFYFSTINKYFWGIIDLDIDIDLVSNWQFSIKSIRAIMRDGTPLCCPQIDKLPSKRSFQNLLTPEKQYLTVFIGLPHENIARPNVRVDSESASGEKMRFERIVKETNDLVTGARSREIEYISNNLEIRFDSENSDAFNPIPIAKLRFNELGNPEISKDFIPPSLTLSSCPQWIDILSSLYGRIIALASSTGKKLGYGSDQTINLNLADIPRFLKMQELVLAIPILMEFYHNRNMHPFLFYQAISQLAGRMGVIFGSNAENWVDEFPPYNHDDPFEGIGKLYRRLNGIFDIFDESREGELQITAIPGRKNMWSGKIPERIVGANGEYFIWAFAEMNEDKFLQRFVNEFKIASPERIDQLITYGLPGISLTKIPYQPSMLPAPHKGHYFGLDLRHPYWQEILTAKELVLSCPDDFANPDVRIYFIRS